jgi:hypothetical protein
MPTLVTLEDRLIVSLGKDVLIYREMLQIALGQHHETLKELKALEARYARLLEDFRALNDGA